MKWMFNWFGRSLIKEVEVKEEVVEEVEEVTDPVQKEALRVQKQMEENKKKKSVEWKKEDEDEPTEPNGETVGDLVDKMMDAEMLKKQKEELRKQVKREIILEEEEEEEEEKQEPIVEDDASDKEGPEKEENPIEAPEPTKKVDQWITDEEYRELVTDLSKAQTALIGKDTEIETLKSEVESRKEKFFEVKGKNTWYEANSIVDPDPLVQFYDVTLRWVEAWDDGAKEKMMKFLLDQTAMYNKMSTSELIGVIKKNKEEKRQSKAKWISNIIGKQWSGWYNPNFAPTPDDVDVRDVINRKMGRLVW